MATNLEKIKAWAAPILFSSVTYLLWQDISEMKSDVKKLLADSEYKKAKIETLINDVEKLKTIQYGNGKTEEKLPVYYKDEKTYFLPKKIDNKG